jgi:hypothetical protein
MSYSLILVVEMGGSVLRPQLGDDHRQDLGIPELKP